MNAPEMNTIRKKQLHAALTYTVMIAALAAYGYFYLYSSYVDLFAQGEEAQKIYSETKDTADNGISIDRLKAILERNLKDKKQISSLLSDKEKLADAIKKPASVTTRYDEWLLSEAGKESQLDAEVSRNADIIGNIIPTFAQQNIVNANLKEVDNIISFKSFVEYVEVNLLKKYQLESYSPVGLSSITFDKESGQKTSNIGSFKITLDIKGTNANIKGLLTAIQDSGKLIIQDGKLVSPVAIQEDGKFSGLANLLMKVDSARFDAVLDNDGVTNKGSIDIRFFVRGIGSQEFTVLRSGLVTKYQDIQKNIARYSDCKKLATIVCADTQGSRSVGAIKSLQRDLAGLKGSYDALKSVSANADISAELDRALVFNASLQAIEKNLQDNIVSINNLTKVWVK